ncbi:Hypothetical protein PHPALM_2278 [Phytophthora palmivora]|uniref:Integrase catalytic domain-containing protein n=1 Tax=Phytophthora palmivora TaxID=4796 RepID=A0A2P4YQ71_9STRA|nr:Hypothetical protein PHPALM_2278 [Phytophthora palmivora]
MVHLAPVSATVTATQSAAIFLDIVYRHHGMPTSVVSDRDPRFTAAFWTELFKLMGTRLKMSTASHPETDGQTERANRVVEDVLRSYATSFKSWSTFLPMVEFAINNAEHASTGLTPFYVNYGRHPRVPALLGVERSMTQDAIDIEDNSPAAPSDAHSAGTRYRDSVHGTDPSLVNGVITRSAVRDTSRGMRTRSATVAAPDNTTETPTHQSNIATWTSRTLINPSMSRRAVEYHDTAGAAAGAAPPSANFDPNPVPQPLDTAAVHEFTQRRHSIVRYVRDAIAMTVDRQKENADRRGRKNMETFAVGDRVLLSTAGIQPTLVTNLGANKLAPRYIGPFKVLKVLGDAYTLQLPTALRLHPTFYVGRLRRYHPATIPNDDLVSPATDAAPHGSVDDSGNPDPPVPAAPADRRTGSDAARLRRPGNDPPFERDGPAPLVDRAGNIRHIVEAILQHDDFRAAPPGSRAKSSYADVPDCVAAYEASVALVSSSLNGAVLVRRA